MSSKTHWCPNGCGKKVTCDWVFTGAHLHEVLYTCFKCKTKYTKQELLGINHKVNHEVEP